MRSRHRYGVGLVLIALLVAGAACDSGVEPVDDPVGVVLLRSDGSEAARFVAGGNVTGQLAVSAGSTATYRVRVIAKSGALLDVDGALFDLERVMVIIPSVVGVSLQGADQIVLTGLVSNRQTTLQFSLQRAGREEFLVSEIPVRIQ